MGDQLQLSLENLWLKLITWFDKLILNLPNIFLALLVFLLAMYLSKKVSSRVKKSLKMRVKQDSVRNLISTALSIAIVVLGLVLALGILNLDQALNSLITGAGVAGLAIGLAVQGTLSNTFSGISLSIKNDINVGDFIETNGFAGTIETINLRDTKIRTLDNNVVVIPNNSISNNSYKNYSLTRDLRVIIEVGVGYESDLEKVLAITEKVITEEFPYRKEDFEFYYTSFGDSAINVQVRFWIQATQRNTLTKARSRAIMLIKKTYDQESINIPFPIRTVITNESN